MKKILQRWRARKPESDYITFTLNFIAPFLTKQALTNKIHPESILESLRYFFRNTSPQNNQNTFINGMSHLNYIPFIKNEILSNKTIITAFNTNNNRNYY